jgi:hypothetical protein
MLESEFQSRLKKKIKERLPGCIVLKSDPNDVQGIPDLLILHNDKWAGLECKKTERSKKQPNQTFYVELMNEMSFASFVTPDNEEVVLDALERSLSAKRSACVSKRK